MENHGNREEILEAKSIGTGRAMRTSITSNEHTFYYAMRTERGLILRIAKDSSSIFTLIAQMAGMIVLIGIGVLIVCVVLARRLTKNLIFPILCSLIPRSSTSNQPTILTVWGFPV